MDRQIVAGLAVDKMHLLVCKLPLGLAPRMAKLTFAFRPSMMGLGSLHALSAAGLSPIITCTQINRLFFVRGKMLGEVYASITNHFVISIYVTLVSFPKTGKVKENYKSRF